MEKNNYIDNDELQAEMDAWRASSSNPDERVPSERLGELLILMHDKILFHKNFNGYRPDLKEEMKSYSLYRILKCGLKSFKFGTSKPFSYFTRAIFMNYITCIGKYYDRINKHQEYLKGQLMQIDTHGDPTLEKYVEQFCTSE